jgi:hypothetical protein
MVVKGRITVQRHPPKPKLTDAERYKRFLDAAKEVGASDDPKDFDKAFMRIVGRQKAGPAPDRPTADKDHQGSDGQS